MHFEFSPSFPYNFNQTHFTFLILLNPNPKKNNKTENQKKTRKMS